MNNPEEREEPMDIGSQNNANLTGKNERKRDSSINKEKHKENVVTSGNIFIKEFARILNKYQVPEDVKSKYLQKVLHSIFFFGHIECLPIAPIEFIPGPMQTLLQNKYPKPFQEYNTHLPHQTPYSLLLECIAEVLNPADTDQFVNELVMVNELLWKLDGEEGNQPVINNFAFSASVITYSFYKDPQSNRAHKTVYGASMACKGKVARTIMIAVSAVHIWDKAISFAVCCGNEGPAIEFPEHVYCDAYRFQTKRRGWEKIPPCKKCNRIFKKVHFHPLYEPSEKMQDWPFGNCAEAESLSKLLLCTREVREATRTVADSEGNQMCREEIETTFREKHEGMMRERARKLLHSRKFPLNKTTDWLFFTPA